MMRSMPSPRQYDRPQIVRLLRNYGGYDDFADQLITSEPNEGQPPRSGDDESTIGPGDRKEEFTNQSDIVPSRDSQQAASTSSKAAKRSWCGTSPPPVFTRDQCANGKSHHLTRKHSIRFQSRLNMWSRASGGAHATPLIRITEPSER